MPLAPRGLLVAGIAALVALHTWFAVDEAKVIDVGVAGVVGADRLADGEDIYGEEFAAELPESGDVRGDVYGPVNYLAYVAGRAGLALGGRVGRGARPPATARSRSTC